VLNVSEEWRGFSDLFTPMQEHLGITSDWYLETTARPFETDARTLFDRRSTAT